MYDFFFLNFQKFKHTFFFSKLCLLHKFIRLSIKITYHTSPYLFEITEDRLVDRGSKTSYFRFACLIFTN